MLTPPHLQTLKSFVNLLSFVGKMLCSSLRVREQSSCWWDDVLWRKSNRTIKFSERWFVQLKSKRTIKLSENGLFSLGVREQSIYQRYGLFRLRERVQSSCQSSGLFSFRVKEQSSCRWDVVLERPLMKKQ